MDEKQVKVLGKLQTKPTIEIWSQLKNKTEKFCKTAKHEKLQRQQLGARLLSQLSLGFRRTDLDPITILCSTYLKPISMKDSTSHYCAWL